MWPQSVRRRRGRVSPSGGRRLRTPAGRGADLDHRERGGMAVTEPDCRRTTPQRDRHRRVSPSRTRSCRPGASPPWRSPPVCTSRMVFLHVAPSNTVTKQHGTAIDDWIYPEFEQNWKLFAPNPLQQNIAVQVRAEVRTADGGVGPPAGTTCPPRTAGPSTATCCRATPSRTSCAGPGTSSSPRTTPTTARSACAAPLRDVPAPHRGAAPRPRDATAAGDGGVVERPDPLRTTNVPAPKWSEEKVSDTAGRTASCPGGR